MFTVILSRDGRTWYGRKLYRVTLKGQTGMIAHTRLTRPLAVTSLREIALRLVIENRPHTFEGEEL